MSNIVFIMILTNKRIILQKCTISFIVDIYDVNATPVPNFTDKKYNYVKVSFLGGAI